MNGLHSNGMLSGSSCGEEEELGRVEDVFVGNLISEEGMEGRQEAGDELVFFFDEVCGDGGEGEELEGKVSDGISAPPVYEEVGV